MQLSEYREDLTLHEKGAPISVGDAIFYIRRIGTPESNKFLKELRLSIFGPFCRHDDMDHNELFAHWLTEYGCTGWDGVQDESGADLPYSQQAARKVFLNPEYYLSLNTILTNAAATFENYLHEQLDQDIDALKKP